MDEFIDAMVAEIVREAQRYPIQKRVSRLYDLQMMISHRISGQMMIMTEEARREKKSISIQEGGD